MIPKIMIGKWKCMGLINVSFINKYLMFHIFLFIVVSYFSIYFYLFDLCWII